jgi:hypothetical protein
MELDWGSGFSSGFAFSLLLASILRVPIMFMFMH